MRHGWRGIELEREKGRNLERERERVGEEDRYGGKEGGGDREGGRDLEMGDRCVCEREKGINMGNIFNRMYPKPCIINPVHSIPIPSTL